MLKERPAKKRAPLEDRSFLEYLGAAVNTCRHFFSHYVSSDRLAMDTSEIDVVDRSGHLQQLLKRLSQPAKETQYFLPLGSARAD